MRESDALTSMQEAIFHLERALALLDEMGHHIAAAQLDNVLHLVHSSPGNDLGK